MKRFLLVGTVLLLATLSPPPGRAAASVVADAAAPPPVLRVMPLGDSITAGDGSSTGNGYREPLRELMAGQKRYTVTFVGSQRDGDMPNPENEGHSGYFIDDISAGVDDWLAAAQPQVVLLHIGINDLDRGADKVHAVDRLRTLVDRIYTDRPGVAVVLQGLIPTTEGLEDRVKEFNRWAGLLPGIEARSGRFLRFVQAPALTEDEFHDRLHPDDDGYQRLAQTFYPPLDQAAAALAVGAR
ncbi:lysophospholipase L1-like esterase [Kitasatospora sp. MAP12-15]|uniref:SGNH/GDSL hydrolase family protein n=1 Tax=unclassified Kitasatospora TaxID=2633591 RepID=UPI00247430D3|nr:SGNH/GDSL hydrolase family protein [Kitasatospora sp. MAP12-44]MDH6112354.1 lysophospholipase L1-like esterase [Kitasatospora sp. MAP12-44]